MTERRVVINEATPGIVHVSIEAMDEMLAELGWRKVTPTSGGDHEYVRHEKRKTEARPPHPLTQIGRK